MYKKFLGARKNLTLICRQQAATKALAQSCIKSVGLPTHTSKTRFFLLSKTNFPDNFFPAGRHVGRFLKRLFLRREIKIKTQAAFHFP
jgi:hypothetical protein